MPPMDDLEALLQSLPALKPPGATKPKIDAITSLCITNIKDASTIVQKIYRQFQNSPATHKLGVLYVVDSVTRQWVDRVRQAGQAASRKDPAQGTYAFGARTMAEKLPLMMVPLIESAPDNQKEKISKLVDIWDKSQTFPLPMLTNFREKLQASKTVGQTYAPPGNPPNNVGLAAPVPAQAAPPIGLVAATRPDANSLAALANIVIPVANPPQVSAPQYGTNGHASAPGAYFVPQVNSPAAAAQTAPGLPIPNDIIMQLFQAVTNGQIRPEQATQLLQMVQNTNISAAVPPQAPVQNVAPYQNGQVHGQQQDVYQGSQASDSRSGAHNAATNGQQGLYRDRSQSPPRRRASPPHRRGSIPKRRESPTYGAYDPSAVAQGTNAGRQQQHDRGRGGRNRRQRSPPAQRRQPSPAAAAPVRGMQPKFVEYDNSLPRESIRVLSRTLFVGGATGTERELREIFGKFGKVQTCIVNHDKRHAFVKMVNRHDSLSAREGMEQLERSHDPSISAKARQTRWGVGFGPRDCADYSTGISTIPINRLTEADHKWAMTAEYGGTGGIPITGGMVFEEPDIEIGAGVSSKAISRRIVPETTGTRRGGFSGVNSTPRAVAEPQPQPNPPQPPAQPRYHMPDRHEQPRRASPRREAAIGVPPPVPGFGFQIPVFPAKRNTKL